MFSNLKKMIEEKRFSSIIFLMPENSEIKMERNADDYNIIFQVNEGFEEHNVSKDKFLKCLENAMKKFAFSGDWKIVRTVKGNTVCSFRIERA